ncbi:hypothetical protein [Mucilaginibacter sp.]|uniref:hypothetical protein n=1 Tax=Mucilaginibacter sp. TaxID=1882438 RepID=UPI003264BADE
MTTKGDEGESQLERIQKFLDENKHLNPFANIDPVEWQREIRKEWDRDFSKLDPPIKGDWS